MEHASARTPRIARTILLFGVLLRVVCAASADEARVFLRVPFDSPSELISHTRDGSLVRHLSDGWALVEAPASASHGSRAVVVGPVRPEYVYAWVAGGGRALAGVEVLLAWRGYALVGTPREGAHTLHQAAAPHQVAPLGVVNEQALHPFAAPSVTVSVSQLDAVTRGVLDAFDAARWEASVRSLAENGGARSRYSWRVRDAMLFNGHPPTDAAADLAADWIAEQLRSYGYSPWEHLFPYSAFAGATRAATFRMRNIIAECPGAGPDRERVILVVAHYDTKASRTDGWETEWRDTPAPGADDNATGVATVLEAARLLAGLRVAHTVRFVLFSAEELGLVGSRHYADAVRRADEEIMAVINIDMVGSDTDGRFDLHVVANRGSRWLLEAVESMRRVVDAQVALLPRVNSDLTFSDHAPFWWEGYSGVFFTEETDFDADEFPQFYHTSDDTFDKINVAYGTAAARLICGVVGMLAAPVAEPGPSALPSRSAVSVLSASAFPNPYSPSSGEPLRIEYDLADAVDLRAEVYTASGRRVFTAATFPAPTSAPVILWDGRTQDKHHAPPGLYFVHVEARDRTGLPHLRTLRVVVTP